MKLFIQLALQPARPTQLIDALASEVKCLRVIERRDLSNIQKQDDILSQENKAKARARYKADPEKKKASVRDSYNADIESKQSAKRQRYQEDVEENRAAKRQKYEANSAAIKASERNRYCNDPAVRLAKRAAERKRYCRGHRTTLPPKGMSWHVVLH